nr:CD166 antigen isoform X2 [Paramormyrops kingsleyae]
MTSQHHYSATMQNFSSLQTITALYGETIVVPCNPTRGTKSANLMFTKWTYEKDDGSNGDLLVKQSQKDEVTIQATGIYKDRVNMASNFSLLISRATLADQKTFTCINVGETDIEMFSTQVQVYKTPSPPQIKDKVKVLEKSKLIKVSSLCFLYIVYMKFPGYCTDVFIFLFFPFVHVVEFFGFFYFITSFM